MIAEHTRAANSEIMGRWRMMYGNYGFLFLAHLS
jgi:hypothetical protein